MSKQIRSPGGLGVAAGIRGKLGSGIPKAASPSLLARVIPAVHVPSPDQREGSYEVKTFTIITKSNGEIVEVYAATAQWMRVKLTLETAGQVAVSTDQQFMPADSGKGILLQTLVPFEIDLPKGKSLYLAASAVNRVAVVVQPFPWLEQILGGIVKGFDMLVGTVASAANAAIAIARRK